MALNINLYKESAKTESAKTESAKTESAKTESAKKPVPFTKIENVAIGNHVYTNSDGKMIRSYSLIFYPARTEHDMQLLLGKYNSKEKCIRPIDGMKDCLNNGKTTFNADYYAKDIQGAPALCLKPAVTHYDMDEGFDILATVAESLGVTQKMLIEYNEVLELLRRDEVKRIEKERKAHAEKVKAEKSAIKTKLAGLNIAK